MFLKNASCRDYTERIDDIDFTSSGSVNASRSFSPIVVSTPTAVIICRTLSYSQQEKSSCRAELSPRYKILAFPLSFVNVSPLAISRVKNIYKS
jgi:hypothetical protein